MLEHCPPEIQDTLPPDLPLSAMNGILAYNIEKTFSPAQRAELKRIHANLQPPPFQYRKEDIDATLETLRLYTSPRKTMFYKLPSNKMGTQQSISSKSTVRQQIVNGLQQQGKGIPSSSMPDYVKSLTDAEKEALAISILDTRMDKERYQRSA